MGCTHSSIKERKEKKHEKSVSGAERIHRNSSVATNLVAEPATTVRDDKTTKVENLETCTISTVGGNKEEAHVQSEGVNINTTGDTQGLKRETGGETGELVEGGGSKNNLARSTSKGSIVRNGVYYSESELAEDGFVWQPKYWTPDRIGKWVEDTEFPDNLRFADVRKVILQNRTRHNSRDDTPHPSSSSAG